MNKNNGNNTNNNNTAATTMTKHGQLRWHTLGGYLIRKRQEDHKFKSSLGYTHGSS